MTTHLSAPLRRGPLSLSAALLALLVGAAFGATATSAGAQPAPAADAATPAAPDATEQSPTDTAAPPDLATLAARLDATTAELERLRAADAERARQAAADHAAVEELSTRLNDSEARTTDLTAQLDAAAAGTEQRKLAAWGFFDVTFAKTFLDPERTLSSVALPVDSSFLMSGVNLYLRSQMTPSLSTLVETRLTFMPHGYDLEHPALVHIGNYTEQRGEYRRVDSTVQGPWPAAPYRPGGILIERAHIDWTPRDWFGLRLGRFLTPYGIWNQDHGAPVLIGVLAPSIMTDQYLPTAQTGLEAFSRVALADTLSLETAFTLTNGRGPMDEVFDTNDDKALGLAARLSFTPGAWEVTAGGYGYLNWYEDRAKAVELFLDGDLTLADDRQQATDVVFTTTERYHESVLSGDLKVKGKGLTLASEAVVRRVDYDTPPPADYFQGLINGVPAGTEIYAPSFVGYGYYVLAAYDVSLGERLGNAVLTPYAGFDQVIPDTVHSLYGRKQYRGGLSLKPSAYVTLKTEYVMYDFATDELGRAHNVLAQVAVAF